MQGASTRAWQHLNSPQEELFDLVFDSEANECGLRIS
jgi:hypothetical protein